MAVLSRKLDETITLPDLYWEGEKIPRQGRAWQRPDDGACLAPGEGMWGVQVNDYEIFDVGTHPGGYRAQITRRLWVSARHPDPDIALGAARWHMRYAALREADYLYRWAGSPRFIMMLAVLHALERVGAALRWLGWALAWLPRRAGRGAMRMLVGGTRREVIPEREGRIPVPPELQGGPTRLVAGPELVCKAPGFHMPMDGDDPGRKP